MSVTVFKNHIVEQDMQDVYHRSISWNKLQNQTVLVTGATGMLASYLVYFLLYLNEMQAAGIHILLAVRSREKCQRRFGKYLDQEYVRVLQDDIAAPLVIPERIDYIIHAASLASPQYYEKMPIEVALPNALGTYYLLQMARRKQVKGFLFFSSGDVYGKMPVGIGDITETMSGAMDPLDMHSCYGESKRMGETWCAAFAREYGVPARIARIAHTYGPTMDIEHDPRVFASFMRCVYHGEDIVMLSDGSAKRPFCYIADAVAAFFLILLEGKTGEAYNVSNSKEFLSICQLADIMVKLRPELKLKVIRQVREDDTAYLENHSNKANKPTEQKLRDLGWECHYDTFTGFQRVLRYLQDVTMQGRD